MDATVKTSIGVFRHTNPQLALNLKVGVTFVGYASVFEFFNVSFFVLDEICFVVDDNKIETGVLVVDIDVVVFVIEPEVVLVNINEIVFVDVDKDVFEMVVVSVSLGFLEECVLSLDVVDVVDAVVLPSELVVILIVCVDVVDNVS